MQTITDLTPIIKAVLGLAGMLLMGFVIPWAKKNLDTKKLDALATLVRIGVYAAEKMFGSKMGKEKKQYVLDFLRTKGYVLDETALADQMMATVNALIESTVKEMEIEEMAVEKK